MVINRPGAEFLYDGIVYRIGDEIIVIDGSEYDGLLGSIYEIRTDDDKETENEGPDFYCSFNPPSLPADIQRLEEDFSHAYGEKKTLEDIVLDLVIMAPEMVQPISNPQHKFKVFALEEDWAVDDECGHKVYLYSTEREARAFLNKLLDNEKAEGCIGTWNYKSDFKEDTCNNSYECWLDGFYCSNHYSLIINEYEVSLDDTAFGTIGRAYIDASRRADFIEQIEPWEELGKLKPEHYEKMKADPNLPDRIHNALGKNDAYWEAYWDSISEVAHNIVLEYLKKQAQEGAE